MRWRTHKRPSSAWGRRGGRNSHVPGETIEIQFMVWDAGDHNVDSLVLLDKFKWNVTPSPVGVHK